MVSTRELEGKGHLGLDPSKMFSICDVSVLSSFLNDAVVPPKHLTGSGSVNRVDYDTISIAFPSTDSQNSNSN